VNNAAGNFLSLAEDLSPNGFRSVVDIVLNGTFNCTQAFGKHRIALSRPGVVLNIVTTYTQCGSALVLPSACAKAGVYALTTSLAYEWATYGIRLNAIAPGPFPTEGAWARLVPGHALEETFRKRVPLGRFGRPEELADLATFLISDHSSFITGECITIDGGERLNAGQFNFILQSMSRDELRTVLAKMKGGRK
jgi:NAD(P)-dependent dehydrogenase (short-subunit alcohol dehydrogenase family)